MYRTFIAFFFVCTFLSCDTLESIVDDTLSEGALTNQQVARGLKQALEFGINEGAQQLSQVNGYFESPYKILLPPEAREITDKLKGVPGFRQLESEIIKKINRGAEDAAKKAAPIFRDAITQMTFQDAFDILMGNDNAATQYLNRATYDRLYQEFNPVIVESLDKFDAREVWSGAVTAYNKIPLVDKANPDLDDYVTRQALAGLFDMVEKKERDIRNNINARTTDLLRRVFARQDNRKG